MSKVKRVSADQIPVIDISSLVLGEADIEVAKAFIMQARTWASCM